MNKKTIIQAGVALVLLATAALLTVSFFRSRAGHSEGTIFFYDLSEQKLFAAPRDSVPPISGINNEAVDGVRAIVISTSGDPKDKQHRKIAYLEKYTPDLKARLEAVRQAQNAGQSTAGMIPHGMMSANTLVRRPADTQWFVMNTPQGEQVVAEWNVPGKDGKYPAVCVP